MTSSTRPEPHASRAQREATSPAQVVDGVGTRRPPAPRGMAAALGHAVRRGNPAPARGPRQRLLTWPVVSWCLWDWGSAAFNTVVTTFVFTVYLTSAAFGDQAHSESALSAGLTVAGLLIALLAPVTGQRSDRAGRTVAWLGVNTAIVVVICAGLFLVRPAPEYLWLGIILLGAGNVFYELANVSYNGLLTHLASRDRIGAVSGLGQGMGYLGGIILLLVLFVGFINPDVTWLGQPNEDGIGIRVSMVIAAAWFGLAAIPVLVTSSGRGGRRRRRVLRDQLAGGDGRRVAVGLEGEPVVPADLRATERARESVWASYRRLWRTLVSLRRTYPAVLWFLLASAIFRDGLAGIFTYGGVIAQNTFGFSAGEVIVFAVAASFVAGVFTIVGGRLDDRLGPRAVIVASLVIIVVAGLAVFVLHGGGKPVFWVLGLFLAGCVGPAQSASRSFLARLIPAGREGEIFGLYATTGRAVSFLAPALYGAFIWLGGALTGQAAGYWGILGIVTVLVAGLLLMTRVGQPDRHIPTLD